MAVFHSNFEPDIFEMALQPIVSQHDETFPHVAYSTFPTRNDDEIRGQTLLEIQLMAMKAADDIRDGNIDAYMDVYNRKRIVRIRTLNTTVESRIINQHIAYLKLPEFSTMILLPAPTSPGTASLPNPLATLPTQRTIIASKSVPSMQ